MQIPISEARAKLPQLIKQLREDPSLTYEITVHQEIVAELSIPMAKARGFQEPCGLPTQRAVDPRTAGLA